MPYWAVSLLVALFALICVVLILTVLIQKPQGGGLSGAFGAGAGGAGQTAFGAKTGDALTIATIGMFVIYLAIAVGLNFAARPDEIGSSEPSIAPVGGAAPEPAPVGDAGTDEGVTDGASDSDDAEAPTTGETADDGSDASEPAGDTETP